MKTFEVDIDPKIVELVEQARFRARAAPRGYEIGVGILPDGTVQFIEGGERHVQLEVSNYEYVLHTHPDNSPPSVKDVFSLWARPKQKASYVITSRDIWEMRKTPDTETKSANVYDAFRNYRDMEQTMLPWQEGGYARGFAETIGIGFARVRDQPVHAHRRRRRW